MTSGFRFNMAPSQVWIDARDHLAAPGSHVRDALDKSHSNATISVCLCRCSMGVIDWNNLIQNIPDMERWTELMFTQAPDIDVTCRALAVVRQQLPEGRSLCLTNVSIHGESVNGASFASFVEALAGMQLERLQMYNVFFSGRDVEHLTSAVTTGVLSVKTLGLTECQFEDDDAMQCFYNLFTRIETPLELRFSCCVFTEATLARLADAFRDSAVSHRLHIWSGPHLLAPSDRWSLLLSILANTKLAELSNLDELRITKVRFRELIEGWRSAKYLKRLYLEAAAESWSAFVSGMGIPPRALQLGAYNDNQLIVPEHLRFSETFFYLVFGRVRCPQSSLSMLTLDILHQLKAYFIPPCTL